MEKVAVQQRIRPALPTVIGNVDYQREEDLLRRMDEILMSSGVQDLFVNRCVEKSWKEGASAKRSGARLRRRQEQYRLALRCMILMDLLGESYRTLSQRLAQCPLFQWFCGLDELGVVKVPSKSTLHRFQSSVDVEDLKEVSAKLLAQAAKEPDESGAQALELKNGIELDTVWLDSTALKANIHFPVDWVLLRDAVRTLMLATELIRKHGLKHRMREPKRFAKEMNGLCMAMAATRRRMDVKKNRKRILRQMKKLVKTVRDHALRHRDLLDREWETTDWTRPQAARVLERIDQVLLQLPEALDQAHQRIIRGKPVENAKKILSLYDPDVRVIVRGKANAEVEFGNSLLLAEQRDGAIIDWQLHRQSAPGDSQQVIPCIERIQKRHGPKSIHGVCGDRQYESAKNGRWLKSQGIYNGLYPRRLKEYEKKKHAGKFQAMQKRRAQTEARIAILKQGFIGDPVRSRGFENRERSVGWAVLTHNLWVIARLEKKPNEELAHLKAA